MMRLILSGLNRAVLPAAALGAVLAACHEPPPPPVYQAVAVERRDIVVSAEAAGTIQPDTLVEVKSKASGEILDLLVETGDYVEAGTLMVRVDRRQPRNTLAQAEAELDVARARLTNAVAQKRRADELFESRSITEQEHEQALLDYATAKADVVRAQVAVDNARIQLEDTDVRAPISGTVIEKNVERGQVISSPTRDVSGGTVLLKMADLNLVQVRTLVDETDIGKIQPGLAATVVVDAYPNRPFQGEVLKIEPLAQTEQNVTMFPVLIRIDNRGGLLRPGMNAEVEIHIGRREDVLAVPNAALRTPRDVASASGVLGLDPKAVERQLTEQRERVQQVSSQTSLGAATPPGDSATRRHDGAAARRLSAGPQFGGRYIVFVTRGGRPTPVAIRTGLTDLDYAEVVSGLGPEDSVLVLPSAGLVEAQQEFRERVNRVAGGVPGMRQQSNRTRSRGSR